MEYWVYKDKAGEWRWYLRAPNGRKLADSGEGYRHKADCLAGIDRVKHSADAPVCEETEQAAAAPRAA